MITAVLDYAGPTAVRVDETSSRLGFSTNLRRPVRFHARVKEQVVLLRLALQALGEVVWSAEDRSVVISGRRGDRRLEEIVE